MTRREPQVFLRPDVVFEPLVNRWYAWPHLISPVTSALYLANYQLKTLQSFVSAPQLHVHALKQGMAGGPFIQHDPRRAPELQALMDSTRREHADLLQLAAAVHELQGVLAEADGGSLEGHYGRVPAPLRGYVELVYDVGQRAHFRVFEPLLYRSPFYKPQLQSVQLFALDRDDRGMSFGTPRLREPGALELDVPFASPIVDLFASARWNSQPLAALREQLAEERWPVLDALLTTTAPPTFRPHTQPGLRLRYFGHACVLVESRTCNLLFDPLVPYVHAHGEARFGLNDLPPRIDFAVITHSHQDHTVLETLLQLRQRIGCVIVPEANAGSVADPSLRWMLRELGFRNVQSLGELETLEFDGGSLTGLPFLGEHGDLEVRSKLVYLLRLAGRSVVFAADSNNLDPTLYAHLRERIGPLDALFIGMECQGAPASWLYGHLFSKPLLRKHDQTRRLDGSDCRKALDIVERLEPAQVYVYAMGLEPWLGFVGAIPHAADSKPVVESAHFVQACRERGIGCERLNGARDVVLPA
jgi:L-ascorbate metabolism protein UlaG (beta-lactamase superfamily)